MVRQLPQVGTAPLRNQLIDFSPVERGVNSLIQQRQHGEQMDFRREQAASQNARANEALALHREQHSASQNAQRVKQMAGLAQAALADPGDGMQMFQRRVLADPRVKQGLIESGIDPSDGVSAAKMMVAEAAGYVDPLERQTQEARLGLIEAQTARANRGPATDPLAQKIKEAELRKLQQGNAIDQAINGMLSGATQTAPAQNNQPQFQNQSFDQAPQPHPGVQLTAGDAPQAGQQPEQMVQTPAGLMPASKARQLGFAMALRGKGDAGRMFTDQLNRQDLSKTATNQNDTRQLNSIEALARLDEITEQSQERFLTLDSKIKNYGLSWVDSIGALRDKISPEDRAELEAFTKFRRSAVDNMNRYIKEITGAQMSEAEANRLRKAVPDPERDGPTQFMAKLADIKKTTRLSIIRYGYLRKNGFNGSAEQASKQLPLTQMGNIVRETRQKAMQQINAQNPDLPQDQKDNMARQLMQQELGILS